MSATGVREIRINLAWVLGAVLFFIGSYSIGPFVSGVWGAILLALLSAGLAGAALVSQHPAMTWRLSLRGLGVVDAAFTILFAAAMLVLAWPRLTTDLWSDAIYHASLASRPAQLLLFFTREAFPDAWQQLASQNAAVAIQAINLALAAILALVIVGPGWILKRRPIMLAAIWLAAFLLARAALSADLGIFAGGETPPVLFAANPQDDPHPPLRLLPLLVSSAIFGVSDFGFRMAGYTALLLVSLGLYIALRRRLPRWTSALAVLAIATVPGLWQTALSVEASIWLALSGAVLFSALAMADDDAPVQLAPLALLAALAALARAPGFLALAPLTCLLLLAATQASRPGRFEFGFAFAMVALTIMAASVSILFGTPAVSDAPPLRQLVLALADATPFVAVVSVMGLVPLLFVGSALSMRSSTGIALAIATAGYLVLALAVFYGPTKPILWGTPRYQAEIAGPLIAGGLVAFALQMRQPASYAFRGRSFEADSGWLSLLPPAALLGVIAFNLFAIVTLDRAHTRWLSHPVPGNGPKTDAEYDISSAFASLKARGAGPWVYYVGIWYGGFQAVLDGMSVQDYATFSNLNQRHRAGWAVDLNAMTGDIAIRAVVVEPEADFGAIASLTAAGWTQEAFINPRSGLRMVLFTRPGAFPAAAAN